MLVGCRRLRLRGMHMVPVPVPVTMVMVMGVGVGVGVMVHIAVVMVPMMMVVAMAVIVAVVIALGRGLSLLIAEHQRLHRLAHGILIQRHMTGEKSCQARQNLSLHRHLGITVFVPSLLTVAHATLQEVVEKTVQIAVQFAANGWAGKHRLALYQETLVQVIGESIFRFQITAHGQKPSACSSCSNQSNPIGLTIRLFITTIRASFFGSALKCWCAQ